MNRHSQQPSGSAWPSLSARGAAALHRPRCLSVRTSIRVFRWLPLAAAVAVSACSSVPRGGGYYQDDGPPGRAPVDVSQVPDAVPRAEPRSASGNKPYTVFGVQYTPLRDAEGYRERGVASWYGKKFHGRRTSSGEPYDMYAMTAAHRTLPLPSYARVRNLENGRSVVVRVNDRGPFLHNRLIDLSYAAASRLGIVGTGTGMVEVEVVGSDTPSAVVARAPQSSLLPSAHAADTETGPPRLSVQVGAFSRYDNAANLKSRLEQAGFAPVYIRAGEAAGQSHPVYRVRIGPLPTVQRGDQLVVEVARHGFRDALLIVD